jgi:hypothetical protein
MCNVSFIVYVALCAVFCLSVVCYFMWYVYFSVVSYCSTTAIEQNPICSSVTKYNDNFRLLSVDFLRTYHVSYSIRVVSYK